MEISEIKDLMESFDKTACTSFSIKLDNVEIAFEKAQPVNTVLAAPQSAPVVLTEQPVAQPMVVQQQAATVAAETAAPAQEIEGEIVKAPLVGIFYAAASPEAEAYVQVGSKVEEGQVLCLIEAMKMMSEITATRSGVIKKIYVKNQDVVGFEDPLFVIGD